MVDAARLADELRAEQELAQVLERDRHLLEAQSKDLHQRPRWLRLARVFVSRFSDT